MARAGFVLQAVSRAFHFTAFTTSIEMSCDSPHHPEVTENKSL
jgi:hypothetical protein